MLAGAALAFFTLVRNGSLSESRPEPEFLAQNVIAVERGDVIQTLELAGELRPEREVILYFPVEGIVKEVLVREGAVVQAGQELVRLEDAERRLELLRAKQEYRHQDLYGGRKLPAFPALSLNFFSRAQEVGVRLGTRALGIDWTVELVRSPQGQPELRFEADWVWAPAVPESELERLERELALRRAERALEETILRAPFVGMVSEVWVRQGDRVSEVDAILRLVDRSGWVVEASVAERELARLVPGQKAIITFEAYPQLKLEAEVETVQFSVSEAPRGERGSKQLQVHLRLLQSDPRLLAGLSARVSLITQEARSVLRVPLEAVVEANDKHLVTRVLDNKQEEVEVQVGLSDERFIEIRSGLQEGDRILANNYRLYEKYREQRRTLP